MRTNLVTTAVERLRKTFGTSEDERFADLKRKVLGCADTAERLIAYEQKRRPGLSRREAIEAAIERWEWDNR